MIISTAVAALRAGAFHYLTKPIDFEEVARVLGLPKKKLPIIRKAIRISNSTPQSDQSDSGWSLGEMVMEELRELDEVAYVRFASVYRSFQDVSEFRDEIERLERQPSPEERRNQMRLLPDEEEPDEA